MDLEQCLAGQELNVSAILRKAYPDLGLRVQMDDAAVLERNRALLAHGCAELLAIGRPSLPPKHPGHEYRDTPERGSDRPELAPSGKRLCLSSFLTQWNDIVRLRAQRRENIPLALRVDVCKLMV